MKCPVCDKDNTSMLCPNCGFDSSRDYGKYPTFGKAGRGPSATALRQQRQAKQKTPGPFETIAPTPVKPVRRLVEESAKPTCVNPEPQHIPRQVKPVRKVPTWLMAVACVVVLMLGIMIGSGLGRKPAPTESVEMKAQTLPPETTEQTLPPETTEQTLPPETTEQTLPPETTEQTDPPETPIPPNAWKKNILRSDEIPRDRSGRDTVSALEYSVFGSNYKRKEILSVTFLSTLEDASGYTWDVSQDRDGSVIAWVEREGSLYHLYIAGVGGVSAGKSCQDLFSGYSNVEQITFGDSFHTDNVKDMSEMFAYCRNLETLDLSSFETGNVENMSKMFISNEDLTDLNVKSFDTGNVEDMSFMFSFCSSLNNLDLTSFDTAKVEGVGMDSMFSWCESLTDLKLSGRFVTDNINPFTTLFTDCPAGTEWGFLEP